VEQVKEEVAAWVLADVLQEVRDYITLP
jgi:hypothetical protein